MGLTTLIRPEALGDPGRRPPGPARREPAASALAALGLRGLDLLTGDDALIGQVAVALMRLTRGGLAAAEAASISALRAAPSPLTRLTSGLAGADRLARRDQHPLDRAADHGADGGARVDHGLHPAGQARFAASAARDGDDRDAGGLKLFGGQFDHALRRLRRPRPSAGGLPVASGARRRVRSEAIAGPDRARFLREAGRRRRRRC
jgi:hypothetical protein